MPSINQDLLKRYRERSFHWERGLRLKNREQAIEFVNERGFVFFWPINGIEFPSLWGAVAGDRPVADAHDDPGHVTWGWKDALLGKKAWYYAKILRKKGTMISMQAVPYFYALSENYGSPEEDYLTLYEQGRLTLEEKQIYEVLLENGPLDTVQLRKAARMTTRESDSRFNRAITELQADFKIVPTGVTDAGAWHYAFAYDIATRPYPELIEESRYIGELDARQKIVELTIRTLGASQAREMVKLFGWSLAETQQAIDRLEKAGVVRQGLSLDQQTGMYFALPELITDEA